MTGSASDREFEDYLAGKDPVAAAYRQVSVETPPAYLDAALLAAAKKAAESGLRHGSAAIIRRWQIPLSLAAVMVLSVSVVLTVRDTADKTFLIDLGEPIPVPAGEPASLRGSTRGKDGQPAEPRASAVIAPEKDEQQRVTGAVLPLYAPPPPADATKPAQRKEDAERVLSRERTAPPATSRNEPAARNMAGGSGATPGYVEPGQSGNMPAHDRGKVHRQSRRQEADTSALAATADAGESRLASKRLAMETSVFSPELEQRLRQINELWLAEKKDAARDQLRTLLQQHPELQEQELATILAAELLADAGVRP